MMMSVRNSCSISTFALLDLPLREAVLQLINGGWKAIEIMCEGDHSELLDWSEDTLAWLRQTGLRNGIKWSIHAPITSCNPAAIEADSLQASQEILLRTMRIAQQLDCAYVVLHAGELEESENTVTSAALEIRVAAFLQAVLKATEGSKVVIALENVPPYPHLLGVDTIFLKNVLHGVDSPRVRIVFDVGHAHLTGKGQCVLALQQVMPDVIALHLSDNQAVYDDHLPLGVGTVPLKEVFAIVQQFRYSGAWVLELRNMPDALASANWLDRIYFP